MSPASLTIGRMAPLTGSFFGYGTGAYGEGPYGIGTGNGGVLPTTWGARAWDMDGDEVTLAGFLHAPGVGDALALRQQILGYAENTDEEVIPITWAADSTINGYYRVRKAAVAMKGPSLAHGLFEWEMQLERVAGYASPLFESILLGANVVNAHSASGQTPWHAVPAAVTEYSKEGVTASYTRTGSDGAVQFSVLDDYDTGSLRFYLAPEDYYIGAATFELGSSNLFRSIVGLQAENLPTAWRLSNGLVRVTPSTTTGQLDISHYDGTSWDAAKTFQLLINGSHVVNAFTTVTVLRNSAEEVVIRLGCATAGGLAVGPVTVDLVLRRGDRIVRGYIESEQPYAWRVQRASSEAATALTGGIRATSNDASSNRFVLFAAKAFTSVLGSGALYSSSAVTGFDFGIGSEVAGSGASAPNAAADLAHQYFAGQSEQMLVVAR